MTLVPYPCKDLARYLVAVGLAVVVGIVDVVPVAVVVASLTMQTVRQIVTFAPYLEAYPYLVFVLHP